MRKPYRAYLRENNQNDGSDGEAEKEDGAPSNYDRSNAGTSLPRNTTTTNKADILNDWKNFRDTVRGNITKAEAGNTIDIKNEGSAVK